MADSEESSAPEKAEDISSGECPPPGIIQTLFISLVFTILFPGYLFGASLIRKGKRAAGILLIAVSIAFFTLYAVLQALSPLYWKTGLTFYLLFTLLCGTMLYAIFLRCGGVPIRHTAQGSFRSRLPDIIVNACLGGILAYILGVSLAFFNFPQQYGSDIGAYKASFLIRILMEGARVIPAGLIVGGLLGWRAGKVTVREYGIFLISFCSLVLLWGILDGIDTLIHSKLGISEDTVFIHPQHMKNLNTIMGILELCMLGWLAWGFLDITRIRSFFYRLLPGTLLLVLAYLSLDVAYGEQDIFFRYSGMRQMADARSEKREAGARLTVLAAKRYPDFPDTDRRMLRAGLVFMENGSVGRAKACWQWIIEEYGREAVKRQTVIMAGEFLSASGKKPSPGEMVKLQGFAPPARETYADSSWMSVLAAISCWEKNEDSLKLRLREHSRSRDSIQLRTPANLADLRIAATQLGYESSIVTADTENLVQLISKGFPVILPLYFKNQSSSMSIIYPVVRAYDPKLDAFAVINYWILDDETDSSFQERQEVASHILFGHREEGVAEEKEKRLRWTTEWIPRNMLSNRWSESLCLSLLIYPGDRSRDLAKTLGKTPDDLHQATRDFMNYFIGQDRTRLEDQADALRYFLLIGAREPADILHTTALAALELRKPSTNYLSPEKTKGFPEEIEALFNNEAGIERIRLSKEALSRDLPGLKLHYSVLNALFNSALKVKPQDYRELVRLNEAMVEHFPEDTTTRTRQGAMLVSLKRYAEALPYYRTLSREKPESGEYFASYALCLALTGNTGEAMRQLEMIKKEEMSSHALYEHLVLAEDALSKKKYKEAIRQYREVISRANPFPEAHLGLAKSLIATGDITDARRELQWLRDIGIGKQVEDAVKLLSTLPGGDGAREKSSEDEEGAE